MSFHPEKVREGLKHLRRADPVMCDLIKQVGPFALRVHRNRFQLLVRSIISQQISASAAVSIWKRVEGLLAPAKITADALAPRSAAQLRTAGVSPQKARYLLDLSAKVQSGQVRLAPLPRMTDEEVVEELVQVTGIGVWTAQMFLIFSLGRMDVFPHDDLGVRTAIRNLYKLKELPDRAASHQIAAPWRPYATLASWYCWRSLELAKRREEETDGIWDN